MPRRTLLVCLCILLSTSALGAANWPRFRGPNGTGQADDKDIPVTWTDKNILWRTKVPGVGHSSPVVWESKLFVQSAGRDGKDRWLLCYDAGSGKELWKSTLPGAFAKTHALSSLASSTPACDGERVYAVSWDGAELTLYAYDMAGKFLWKQGLGEHKSQHGAGISPITHDGKVFVTNDDDASAHVLAFDAVTGKPAWKLARPRFRACYSTPFILDSGRGAELIVASTAGVTSYVPRDGAINWNFTWKFDGMGLRTVASPIFANGLVVIGSGDGKGDRHLIAVRAGGKGDVSKTHLAWENKATFPYVPSMLAHGDHVYSVNDKGMAYCHEAATGKEVWEERLGGKVLSSPILIDGKVYVCDTEGDVFVFPAAPKFKQLARNTLGEVIHATPAVANGRLYIRGKESLFCIGAAR